MAASRRERKAAILRDLGDDAPSDPLLTDVVAVLHFRAGSADRACEILRLLRETPSPAHAGAAPERR